MSDMQSTPPRSTEVVGLADRVLLCVPRGGLNDALCQIEKCWRYAERFERQLVIDTRRSGLMGQFSDYLSVISDDIEVVGRVEPYHLAVMNGLDCHPAEVRGQLQAYRIKRFPDGNRERKSGILVSFDFSIDYPHPLLVHEQSGGGNLSFDLLKRVSLAQEVSAEVSRRLSRLPRDYLGVHVRNTDRQTDYGTFFKDLYPRTRGRTVLVCSDDPRVVTLARELFDQATVITTGNPEIDVGQPEPLALHRAHAQLNDEGQRAQTINALTDLLALGGASELFFAKCVTDIYSGFSRLASSICDNKFVIPSLLSEPPPMSQKQLQERLEQARANNARLGRHMNDVAIRLTESEERLCAATESIAKLERKLSDRDRTIAARGRTIAAMRNSWSWRITLPLRSLRSIQLWRR